MSTNKTLYGITPDGQEIYTYFIDNKNGLCAQILTYGATLDKLFVPDKNGKYDDILIGFSDLNGHIERSDYQGMIVGRYANRIAKGRFQIDSETFEVAHNENQTCLHGGSEFSHAVWDAEIMSGNSVRFSYTSPDGANGFPGEMKVTVTYTLNDNNELSIAYTGVCTHKTVMNFTNHAYFNLGGYDSGAVTDHMLWIDADRFTPMDADSIPTGELKAVQNTPFDFTVPKPIGQDINADDEQIVLGQGYDHNFCFNNSGDSDVKIRVTEPKSSRVMEVMTDLPGVQLYTGNFLDGVEGKNGSVMNKHSGFCLETQFFPDTPNQPGFPSCTFDKNETFRTKTTFRFSLNQ